MTEELKQKIDKIVRDYYTSSKALTLYRNLKGLAYDVAKKSTQELEKENAELKAIVRNTKAVDESFALQTMQLTTAIEIIKDLLSLCEGETDSKLVFTRAEQFLSEVEK